MDKKSEIVSINETIEDFNKIWNSASLPYYILNQHL